MKNRIFPLAAAAACACAAPAWAQSTVNISGTIDIGVFRAFDRTTQVGPISRSSLTFSGAEDLGGGLAATFKLSHRFDPDSGRVEDGVKPFWHGESTVGLKGSFGQLRLGRAMEAVTANDWAYDPWYNFDRIASPAWQYWHFNYSADRTSNAGKPEFFRLNNGIFYDSPSFGGFSFSLSGSPEKGGSNTKDSAQGSASFSSKGFSATLSAGENGSGDKDAFAGAKYTMGNLSVMGAYDRSTFAATPDSVAKAYTVGARYEMGRVALMAGYGHLDVDGVSSNFIGLGSQYTLSKKTYVYLSAGRNRPASGGSQTAFGVGVNHSF